MEQKNQNFTEISEADQSSGISIYRNLAAAAASLLLCAGVIGGGVYALNQRRNLSEMPSAEAVRTEPAAPETTFHSPAQVIIETVTSETHTKETVRATEPQKAVIITATSAPAEITTQAVTAKSAQTKTVTTQTVPAIQETEPETELISEEPQEIVPDDTQVPEPETIPETVSETVPETQYVVQETEVPAPETEAPPQETLSTETFPALGRDSYYHVVSEDRDYIPGFVLMKFVDDTNPELYCMYKIRSVTDGSESEEVETLYRPTYIPDECAVLETVERPVNRGITYHYYLDGQTGAQAREAILEAYPDVKYPYARGCASTLSFKVMPKKLYNDNLSPYAYDEEEMPPANLTEINGHTAYVKKNTENSGYENQTVMHVITWDNGDYIMTVSGYFPLEELVKMAESIRIAE